MKRRLNIAVALIHRPKVLLMDEPTVGVDPQSRNFIFEHVELLKAQGMAVIYTTHYMEEAERLCDRVAIMDEGRILASDSTANLLSLLGGGLIYVGFDQPVAELLPALEALPFVQSASLEKITFQDTPPSGSIPSQPRAKIETQDANRALLALIELCLARQVRITSLQVMEPNLESVFLHLTSKQLRD
jgi:ABC-2 type transport system ATP-binding protein